jgi:hypothetical protein
MIDDLRGWKKHLVQRKGQLVNQAIWGDILALPDRRSRTGEEFAFDHYPRYVPGRRKGTRG